MSDLLDMVTVEHKDEWIGRTIDGRYEVLELLGVGGMGAVYVAEHRKLRKKVALKVLHSALAHNGEITARFAREAMASARLDHPHVASVTDYGTLPEGGAFLVMPLVSGEDLLTELNHNGRMPWRKACDILAQVADALAAAHTAGVIHRDLKPENILLEPRDDGTVLAKVLDFGVARVALDEDSDPEEAAPGRNLTRVGTVVGTPGYMAPEQAAADDVDHRVDLYSLGVVLWETIVGKQLFDSRDLSKVLSIQLTRKAPGIRASSGVEVPQELEDLVASMLSASPDQRPSSASQTRDALRELAYSRQVIFDDAETDGGHKLLHPEGRGSNIAATNSDTHTTVRRPGNTPTVQRSTPKLGWEGGIGEILRSRAAALIAATAAGVFLLSLLIAVVLFSFLSNDSPEKVAWSLEVKQNFQVLSTSAQRDSRAEAAEYMINNRDTVPPVAVLMAELETARCAGAPQLEQLVQLRDPRALPMLVLMFETHGHECLEPALSSAIDALRATDPALQ